ncbi:hypothetical protein HYQ46_006913 [Verticillium longisporum]|nr:hypothetical protein HYQ46_006913 [Verticillium longisporum]
MGLPAFTIHSVVRYSGRAMKNMKNTRIRTWGPIGLGLAVVPALPTLFDEPVENAVEWLFHKGFEAYGGKQYVGDAPTTGREDLLTQLRTYYVNNRHPVILSAVAFYFITHGLSCYNIQGYL